MLIRSCVNLCSGTLVRLGVRFSRIQKIELADMHKHMLPWVREQMSADQGHEATGLDSISDYLIHYLK